MKHVRITKTPEAVPHTRSFKVTWPGGEKLFYYDDVASRRLRPEIKTQAEAKADAQAFARKLAINTFSESYSEASRERERNCCDGRADREST